MKTEWVDQVVRFVSGRMTDDERRSFSFWMQSEQMRAQQWQVKFIAELMTVAKIFSKRKLKTDLQELERKIELEERGEEPKQKGRFTRWWKWLLGGFVILAVIRILFLVFTDKMSLEKLRKEQNGKSTFFQNNEDLISVMSLPIVRIVDGKFGMVKQNEERTIFIAIAKDKDGEAELAYRYCFDTLFIRTLTEPAELGVYDFNVDAHHSTSVNDMGEMIVYDKPELKGRYLKINETFYKMGEMGETIINNPLVTDYHSYNKKLVKLTISSAYTRLDFLYKNEYESGGWVSIEPKAFLRGLGAKQELTLTSAKKIPYYPNKYFFNKLGDTLTYSLYFPPIQVGLKEFDFIESESSGEIDKETGDLVNYNNMYGVELYSSSYENLKERLVSESRTLELLKYYTKK